MRKFMAIAACCLLALSCSFNTVYSTSLDAAIQQGTESTNINDVGTPGNVEVRPNVGNQTQTQIGGSISNDEKTQNFVNGLNDATELTAADLEGANAVMGGIKVAAAWCVQILAYFTTAFLAVWVLLDLVYLTASPLRGILDNGKVGNPAAGSKKLREGGAQGQSGNNTNNAWGGTNSYGPRSGGYNSYNNGGLGVNNMNNMNGAQGQQQAQFRSRCWVSDEALNVVAAAEQTGENVYILYASAATVKLVLAPILVILASTGVLAKLGIMLGTVIGNVIIKLIGML